MGNDGAKATVFPEATREERMRLRDRVAIVTGGARGIGQAIALGFAREGAAVVVNDCRTDGQAREVVQSICSSGGRAIFVQADISDLSQHERLVTTTLEEFSRLDILVNNAGVEFREPFLQAQPEGWDRTLAVNLKGAYFLSQTAARTMMRSGGRIINIASVHDTVPLRDRSMYSISKAGMAMLVKSLALELAEHQITVNAIAPGAIFTDMNRKALSDEGRRAKLLERIPLRRIGQPEDIVGAAVFLASAESDYVTGVTIHVDGGFLLF